MSDSTTTGPSRVRSRRLLPWAIAILGVAIIAVIGGLYLLFGHAAPSAVGLSPAGSRATTHGGPLIGGSSGTWTVDA